MTESLWRAETLLVTAGLGDKWTCHDLSPGFECFWATFLCKQCFLPIRFDIHTVLYVLGLVVYRNKVAVASDKII